MDEVVGQTPLVRWFSPMVHIDIAVRPFSPNQRAAVTMSSALAPEISAARAGVYSARNAT